MTDLERARQQTARALIEEMRKLLADLPSPEVADLQVKSDEYSSFTANTVSLRVNLPHGDISIVYSFRTKKEARV